MIRNWFSIRVVIAMKKYQSGFDENFAIKVCSKNFIQDPVGIFQAKYA